MRSEPLVQTLDGTFQLIVVAVPERLGIFRRNLSVLEARGVIVGALQVVERRRSCSD
jgi:hypothetical protein